MVRGITIGNLCELSGYSRDQIRGLLSELPQYAKRKGEPRVANVYSSHDMLVVMICCRLESQYGLKRTAVAMLSQTIAQTLAVPRLAAKGARLVLRLDPPTAKYVERVDDLLDGLVVALDPIFTSIDAYLATFPVHSSMYQRELTFAPVALPVANRRLRRSAHTGAVQVKGKGPR
jgi:hypothetical protein